MFLKETGALLLLLTAVFIFGNLWFHFTEAVLRWIKKIFMGDEKPSAWHAFPTDEDESE